MCGIAGIFDTRATGDVDGALLKRMTDAIAHRGPDGEGFHREAGVALGHRRLAIIDVAGGAQPMFNEDRRISLVYNGEIYNYRDLIPELEGAGHVFRTRCDTEVVIHAWEEWGPRCVDRFRGMFAFALHDARTGTLFLARDRLGKKPLYYAMAGGHLLFASELKGLLAHPRIARRIDPLAVDDYLAFGYVPDPATIYEGVFKLPPGHHLTVVRGRPVPSPRRYWRPRFNPHFVAEADAAAALIGKLEQSTRIRLMSEVPLGAFLSGGVDSSGVVAMMAGNLADPVKTFAIGFGAEGDDELAHAARVAERYRTNHHAQIVDVDPLNQYRAMARIFDEPFADSSAMPTYRVCQYARRHVTVALSGDAGDELFAGYRRYRMFAATEKLRRLFPDTLRRGLFGGLGRLYPKLDGAPRWMRAQYTFKELAEDSAAGYFRTVCHIHDGMRGRLYSPGTRAAIAGHAPGAIIAAAMDEADSGDPLARAQYADLMTYLPGDILTKVDRASMATSLEVRVPMLDHEFVEFAGGLPGDLKLKGGEGKHILKRALEPYVPHENLYRKKQGFTTSLAASFRGPAAALLREGLFCAEMADSGLFDRDAIGDLVAAHESGRADHSRPLWALLMFAGFLREVHFAGNRPDVAALATA